MNKKIEKKKKILGTMVDIYKKAHPDQGDLSSLEAYALARIEKCPNIEKSIACKSCTIHCFSKEKRAQIKRIMKYSGPRMLILHPLMTMDYFFGLKIS